MLAMTSSTLAFLYRRDDACERFYACRSKYFIMLRQTGILSSAAMPRWLLIALIRARDYDASTSMASIIAGLPYRRAIFSFIKASSQYLPHAGFRSRWHYAAMILHYLSPPLPIASVEPCHAAGAITGFHYCAADGRRR